MSTQEKSMMLDFSNLSLIPQLLEKINLMEKEIKTIKENVVPDLDLTKAKGVMLFLGISKSTLDRKIKEGELKKGVHFIQSGVGENRRYIPEAIKSYKDKQKKFKIKYSAVQSAIN